MDAIILVCNSRKSTKYRGICTISHLLKNFGLLYCNNNSLIAVINVNNCDIRFQLDIGTQTNTIEKKYVFTKNKFVLRHLLFVCMNQQL